MMDLNLNVDLRDHSFCALSYNEAEGWLEAVWRGYVDPQEAQRGAEAYLDHAAQIPSPFLLNENSGLQGPWFTSLDWLAQVWVPRAVELGLRCVAHVVQADSHHDILTRQLDRVAPFELQIFQNPTDARQWLREARRSYLAQMELSPA